MKKIYKNKLMIESFSGRKGREKIKFGDLTFRFSRLSSTMDFARQLARLNYPEGTAVIAKEQTAGRGTKGRVWHSAPGKGLYVSFILRPIACSLSLLPLTVGLAAVKAVEEGSGIRGQLKWPNDLILEGKKLGGILCEGISEGQKSQYAIAGIGINLNHSAKEFPPDISETATSLFLVTGKNYDNDEIFHLLSKNLQFWYNELEKGQDKKIIEEYQANLIILKGQNLILRTPDGEIKGQFEGIGPNGGLKLKLNQGKIKTFYASEIIKVLS